MQKRKRNVTEVTPAKGEAYSMKVLRVTGVCTVLCDKHGFITVKAFSLSFLLCENQLVVNVYKEEIIYEICFGEGFK